MRSPIVMAGLVVALAASGLMLEGYTLRVLTLALINVIAVLGLNLAYGYCGVIHLGQAAFAGLGAYATALLTTKLGWPIWLTIPTALLTSTAIAVLISVPLVRLKGHYLALATVGINVIFELIAKNWIEVTNGYNGVTGIPRLGEMMSATSPDQMFYLLAATITLLAAWAALRLRRSHLGRAMIALRDDEIAAVTAGIDPRRTQVIAFALSGFFAAVAGVLYAHYIGFISPTDFAVAQSILYLAMLVVGGEGAVAGAIIGALILTFLPEALRDAATAFVAAGGDEKSLIARLLKDGYLAIYGLITLLVLTLMPTGLIGLAKRRGMRTP